MVLSLLIPPTSPHLTNLIGLMKPDPRGTPDPLLAAGLLDLNVTFSLKRPFSQRLNYIKNLFEYKWFSVEAAAFGSQNEDRAKYVS